MWKIECNCSLVVVLHLVSLLHTAAAGGGTSPQCISEISPPADGRCFFKPDDNKRKHAEAMAICQQDGAHLPVIDTIELADRSGTYLKDALNIESVWVDGESSNNNKTVKNDWHYTDGTMIPHDLWASGEPNRASERCALLKNARLRNVKCNNKCIVICEKKTPLSTTTTTTASSTSSTSGTSAKPSTSIDTVAATATPISGGSTLERPTTTTAASVSMQGSYVVPALLDEGGESGSRTGAMLTALAVLLIVAIVAVVVAVCCQCGKAGGHAAGTKAKAALAATASGSRDKPSP